MFAPNAFCPGPALPRSWRTGVNPRLSPQGRYSILTAATGLEITGQLANRALCPSDGHSDFRLWHQVPAPPLPLDARCSRTIPNASIFFYKTFPFGARGTVFRSTTCLGYFYGGHRPLHTY